MSKNKISILYTTIDNEDSAKNLAKNAIQAKKAACANIFQGKSVYIWENKLKCENEYYISFKTHFYLREDLKKLIQQNHSYYLPIIIELQANCSSETQKWLQNLLL